MTEFPLLCINPSCRKPELGGPRRTDRAWFCPPCIDHATRHLNDIAEAWDDLEQNLTSSEHLSTGDQGKTKNGGKDATGIQINERAVAARTKASALMWFLIRELLDRYDETGRTLTIPEDQTTPSLAQWLARWHVNGWATHPGDEFAVEVFVSIRNTRRDVWGAAYPTGARKLETGLPCVEHATSDLGERVPCHGTMHAWVEPQMAVMPDLICGEDKTHRLDPASWQRAGWRRAHAQPMDADAMARLAREMTA